MTSVYMRRFCSSMACCAVLALTSIAASAQDPRPASVQVAKAQVRELAPSVHAAGLVRSRASADLAASVPGRLQWVAEAGSIVEAGAVVARLDTREMALARAEQAARVNRAAVNLKGLDRELERLRASGNAVSRFAVDQAQSNRDLAAADLEVARAQLAQTDDQLARSRLTAPFAGVVSDRVRRAGEEVARGEIVARLVNPDALEIRLFVPLRHVRAIQPGHVVNVTVDRPQLHGGRGQHRPDRRFPHPVLRGDRQGASRRRPACGGQHGPGRAAARPAATQAGRAA